MFDIESDYKPQIDKLRRLIKSSKAFEEAMELALTIHAITHTGTVSDSDRPTFCDDLLDGLPDEAYSVMPTKKDETIAWHLWHIARIEDLVGNLLIAEQDQILNDAWLNRLGVAVKDTGNAMTDAQIIDLSKRIDKRALIAYRDAVGRQTRALLKSLTPDDLKRKPAPAALDRLDGEGGLLACKNSIWLKAFWGKHTVAGLILLPLTRHHMMHLPDSLAIKEFVKTGAPAFAG
ncbi:DinB family protein [Butyricicoccus faecihominis]|uniref:DinB family protein n=1 Tax=Butyricicoccus faecihominis TaxID=1712515 RepID=UPI002479827F|nr:DinB family protein [Butyricicoccus faecihominis]MCQ5130501.1 DinB family protein [Butyricicoccus faecihominis]